MGEHGALAVGGDRHHGKTGPFGLGDEAAPHARALQPFPVPPSQVVVAHGSEKKRLGKPRIPVEPGETARGIGAAAAGKNAGLFAAGRNSPQDFVRPLQIDKVHRAGFRPDPG